MVTSVYMCEKLDGEGMGGLNFKRRVYLDILIRFRGIYDPFPFFNDNGTHRVHPHSYTIARKLHRRSNLH